VAFRALTSFIQGIYNALKQVLIKKGSLHPYYIHSVLELVQAQKCPIVRLGRVRIH
jgi:hypothetical protein